MINLILGAPGGGKSYEAVVYHIIPAIKSGRKVVTNLPLNIEYFEMVFPGSSSLIEIKQGSTKRDKKGESYFARPFSDISDYVDSWKHPETGVGPLYAIDECHMCLPRSKTPVGVDEWYSMHRHEGKDVLLITQSYGKVSKSIIELVQLVYRVRKNIAMGSSNSYTKKVQDGIRGEVVNSALRTYKKSYFNFYNSHTKSNNTFQESAASDVKPLWKHWTVYCALACFCFAGYLIATTDMNILSPKISSVKTSDVRASKASMNPAFIKPISQNNDKEILGLNTHIVSPPAVSTSSLKKEEEKTSSHPFSKVELHIDGYYKDGSSSYTYILSGSANGQNLFSFNSNDLKAAGYKLKAIAPCLLKADFKKFSTYITCDVPTQDVVGAVGI